MVKKIVVFAQVAAVLYLGALIVTQLGITPEAARRIDRGQPWWFLNPWHKAVPQVDTGKAAETKLTPAQQAADELAKTKSNRRYILAPGAAVNAMIAGLEKTDLQATVPALQPAAPAQPVQAAPEKTAKAAPDARKQNPETAGSKPLRITSLIVAATENGAMVRGFTSAPVERVDLMTLSSPPQMILELHGQFEKYDRPIVVPQNPVFKSLRVERQKGKMRIVGQLSTDKATVSPVTRAVTLDEFMVNLTLGAQGQNPPQASTGTPVQNVASPQAAPAATGTTPSNGAPAAATAAPAQPAPQSAPIAVQKPATPLAQPGAAPKSK